MSTLSSANVTDVNLVLKERTHMRLCINMPIFTHNLGNLLIVTVDHDILYEFHLFRRCTCKPKMSVSSEGIFEIEHTIHRDAFLAPVTLTLKCCLTYEFDLDIMHFLQMNLHTKMNFPSQGFQIYTLQTDRHKDTQTGATKTLPQLICLTLTNCWWRHLTSLHGRRCLFSSDDCRCY